MTTVFFQDLGYEYAITFSYDAELVDLLKTVPKNFRSWEPDTKQWANCLLVRPDSGQDHA